MLRLNVQGYAELTYTLGTALYEYGEDAQTRGLSVYWLDQMLACGADLTEDPWPARASYTREILRLQDLNRSIGMTIRDPDDAARLWTSLTGLAGLAEKDVLGRASRLKIIGDISVNLYDHMALLMRDGGVPPERLQAMLDQLEGLLDDLKPYAPGEMAAAQAAAGTLSLTEDELNLLFE